ncbi:MAG: hypothetical protein KDD19_00335 [Phaeodactylibacter sp.]|nr:hypothetical protein [Phaeodactylibacter sp.]MCB9050264.1 hypothetical protein [Lewinellaceae bacterium]
MLNKNSIPVGLAIGLLLPLLAFGLLIALFHQLEVVGVVSDKGFSPMFRERTTGIIAICLNLIPLNAFQKRRAINSMRGVVLATVLYVIAWVVYFGKFIL